MLIADELRKNPRIEEAVAHQLTDTYGVRARGIADRVVSAPALAARLDETLPFILAQIDTAVEEEFALTLDDVLERRLPVLLRAHDQGMAAAPIVATRMAHLLGWNETRKAQELAAYAGVVARTRQFRARS